MKRFIFFMLVLSSIVFGNSLDEIRKNGVVRIGVFPDNEPFSTAEAGNFDGIEVELGKAIAKNIFGDESGKVEFIVTEANERIPTLKANKTDIVIAAMTITDERAREIDFSMPYFAVNVGVLTKTSDKIANFTDIGNRKIIVDKGSFAQDYFMKNSFETIECLGITDCYKQLKNSDSSVAGYADDNLIVMTFPIVDKSVEVNLKNVGPASFLGIGVQKGNKELLTLINDSLIKLSKDGFFKKRV